MADGTSLFLILWPVVAAGLATVVTVISVALYLRQRSGRDE